MALRMISRMADDQNRNDDDQHPGQAGVLPDGQDDAADDHHRRADHQRQHDHHHLLHLVRVIGRARDQRGRADGVELVQRELLHVREELGRR